MYSIQLVDYMHIIVSSSSAWLLVILTVGEVSSLWLSFDYFTSRTFKVGVGFFKQDIGSRNIPEEWSKQLAQSSHFKNVQHCCPSPIHWQTDQNVQYNMS